MNKIKSIISFLLFAAFSVQSYASAPPNLHQLWEEILSASVDDNGMMNYEYLKNDKKLSIYLEKLNTTPPQDDWSSNEKKAYFMNAYNAWTIKLVVDNLPVSSIKDIGSVMMNIWDLKIALIGNTAVSLSYIEHEVLRKQFNDPRIHFGINCASYSCPRLYNHAFTADNVDKSLELLTRGFLLDKTKNNIHPEFVVLSKIFYWYKSDFEKYGSVLNFITAYTNIEFKNAKINYYRYDWKLNAQNNLN